MNFLQKLFNRSHTSHTDGPPIRFGRYSDSYKSKEQYDAWDRALEAFEKEDYLESYRQFFRYLHDPAEDNVKVGEEKQGRLEFELLQGSRKVYGYANRRRFRAEAKIARADNLNVGILRRLVEENFDLKYCRYALDEENNILVVFDTYSLDSSPYKLYQALKEAATKADKQDDLLLDEFKSLQPVESGFKEDLPEREKEVKYDFLTTEIQRAFQVLDQGNPDPNQYPGAYAYLLLSLCYKLDYLLKPEGFMMETLERIHRQYFSNRDEHSLRKIQNLRKEFQQIFDRPKESLVAEMYRVKSTFGITAHVNHERVVHIIDGELGNMDWYVEQKHPAIALAIPTYIAGYCLFNFAVPKPDRDFFHLFLHVVENDFFKRLGFPQHYYDPSSGELDERAIRSAIRHIREANRKEFPKLDPKPQKLSFESIHAFAKAFMLMVKDLDLTSAK